jgi:multidrug efflux pump subunit AcrA (membrane-fusion protein)
VLWLPPDAIRTAGGRTFVIINSEAGPKRVDVELGLQTRDRVEIVSGLDEGQVVVSP